MTKFTWTVAISVAVILSAALGAVVMTLMGAETFVTPTRLPPQTVN